MVQREHIQEVIGISPNGKERTPTPLHIPVYYVELHSETGARFFLHTEITEFDSRYFANREDAEARAEQICKPNQDYKISSMLAVNVTPALAKKLNSAQGADVHEVHVRDIVTVLAGVFSELES